jgi:hypothetical protein
LSGNAISIGEEEMHTMFWTKNMDRGHFEGLSEDRRTDIKMDAKEISCGGFFTRFRTWTSGGLF